MLFLLLSRAGSIGSVVLLAVNFVEPRLEPPRAEPLRPPAETGAGRMLDTLQSVDLPRQWDLLRPPSLFPGFADPAPQDVPAEEDGFGVGIRRAERWSVRGGIGLTSDPTTFLLAIGGDYFFTDNLSVGPLFQFGIDDDPFIFAPTAHVQWTFDLPGAALDRLKPYIQGGLGFAYLRDDDRVGREDDLGFLINPGAGFDYYVTDTAALGTSILFNVLPGDVLDEEFFFSWQVATFRILF